MSDTKKDDKEQTKTGGWPEIRGSEEEEEEEEESSSKNKQEE